MAHPFFTVGHSTRSVPEFVELLRTVEVQLVVDVRTVPRSRANPQFNRDVLPGSLADFQISYEHVAELGGLRGRQRLVEPSPNGFWENDSFRNYADYALTEDFRAGLARLRELGAERRTAIMCAEAVWWRCHRRIIADYLLTAGETVLHILGPEKIEEARMMPAARPVPGRVSSTPRMCRSEVPRKRRIERRMRATRQGEVRRRDSDRHLALIRQHADECAVPTKQVVLQSARDMDQDHADEGDGKREVDPEHRLRERLLARTGRVSGTVENSFTGPQQDEVAVQPASGTSTTRV
jgi:hypothetical protein